MAREEATSFLMRARAGLSEHEIDQVGGGSATPFFTCQSIDTTSSQCVDGTLTYFEDGIWS